MTARSAPRLSLRPRPCRLLLPALAALCLASAALAPAAAGGPGPVIAREMMAGGAVRIYLPGSGAETAEVELLSAPEIGTATVGPDGRLAYALGDAAARGTVAFRVALTRASGARSEHEIRIALADPGTAAGWGEGDHYRLRTDAAGRSIVEPGRRHARVHVRPGGLDSGTGVTPATAVSLARGLKLWRRGAKNPGVSNWLLFERGHSYRSRGALIPRGNGESPLHPMLVGAWGEGARPVLEFDISATNGGGGPTHNLVIRDVVLGAPISLNGSHSNILFENVGFRREVKVQNMRRLTIRNSDFLDIHREEPTGPVEKHGGEFGRVGRGRDRISGIYVNKVEGLLIENSLNDMSGWEAGYQDDSTRQPPTIFSHGYYLSWENRDLTFRNNVTMRAASTGAQIRSGGFIENNVFIDNNIGFNFLAGDDSGGRGKGPFLGNLSFVHGNVVTNAAFRAYSGPKGALAASFSGLGPGSSVIGNIVAHKYDPNDPALSGDPGFLGNRVRVQQPGFGTDPPGIRVEALKIYGWSSPPGKPGAEAHHRAEIDNADYAADLDRVTIQDFASRRLGRPAGLGDLAQMLRADWAAHSGTPTAPAEIRGYFQEAFGLAPPTRTAPATAVFLPDPRGGGRRWDNAFNWTTGDIAGSVAGDAARLGGNRVHFSGTHVLSRLELASEGHLAIGQGLLRVAPEPVTGGGRIRLEGPGELELGTEGESALAVEVAGGRFANTARLAGALDIRASGGETLLGLGAASAVFDAGDRLTILGGRGLVGFDGGAGEAAQLVLGAGAVLELVPDASGLSPIREFRSGRFGIAEPGLDTRLEIGAGAVLRVDLSGVSVAGETVLPIVRLDTVEGRFARVELTGGAGLDARAVYRPGTGAIDLVVVPQG